MGKNTPDLTVLLNKFVENRLSVVVVDLQGLRIAF